MVLLLRISPSCIYEDVRNRYNFEVFNYGVNHRPNNEYPGQEKAVIVLKDVDLLCLVFGFPLLYHTQQWLSAPEI